MIDRLLPRHLDNDYRGWTLALWILGAILAVRGVIGFNSIVFTYKIATSADGIPVDTFPSAAAQTALSLFALLGVSSLVASLAGIVTLVRYRGAVPLLFAYLLVEQLLRRAVLRLRPMPRAGTPAGSPVIIALLALTAVGLVLSLLPARSRAVAA